MKQINIVESQNHIYAIARVGMLSHLEEMQQGRLRFCSLAYYRGIEHADKEWHDPGEGTVTVLNPTDASLIIGKGENARVLNAANGLLGVQVSVKADFRDRRIMCLHSLNSGEWTEIPEDKIGEFRKSLEISQSMFEHGTHVLIVRNPILFSQRLAEAAKRIGFGVTGKLVHYVDFKKENRSFPDDWPLFIKAKQYQAEREFRIAIQVREASPDPFFVEVGSLVDACMIVTLEEFNKEFQVNFR